MLAALTLITVSTTLQAGTWSAWQPCGNEVSVSVTQVTHDTWTWKFRNDGSTTITHLDFTYTDSQGTHNDVMPVNLKPGEVFGGWAAFTSSSWPIIQLKTIKRANY